MVQPLWLAIVLGGKHAGIQEYKDDDEPEHGLEKKMIRKRSYEKRSYKERSYKKKIIQKKDLTKKNRGRSYKQKSESF